MGATSNKAETPGSGRERVLFLLKRDGPQATARVAQQLGVTAMAVRQHLAVLQAEGLVEFSDEARKVGRPARVWRLTPKAYGRFPDHHGDLAVEMLQQVQSAFGAEGLQRLTEGWTRQQLAAYRAQMPTAGLPLDQRVAALVRIRCAQGFMAEARTGQDGVIELVENHCAIAKAAHCCAQLCGGELWLFRELLGEGVRIERVEHLLAGDRRCTYRIRAQPEGSPAQAGR